MKKTIFLVFDTNGQPIPENEAEGRLAGFRRLLLANTSPAIRPHVPGQVEILNGLTDEARLADGASIRAVAIVALGSENSYWPATGRFGVLRAIAEQVRGLLFDAKVYVLNENALVASILPKNCHVRALPSYVLTETIEVPRRAHVHRPTLASVWPTATA